MFTILDRDRRAYIYRLHPYFSASILLFSVGVLVGLMIVNQFPQITESLAGSLHVFIERFRGLSKLKLAAAIFLNNGGKALAAILLGIFFGLIPALILVVNGAALAVVVSLSIESRGLSLTLLSILPHGVIELPAVFLGSAIGLMMGASFTRKLTAKSECHIGAELGEALRFFATVIVPLLLLAALVETYITSALLVR